MRWVSSFTGRTAELGLLCHGVRGGSTALVVGDAGIGKTRLVAECGAGLEADGWLVVSASCLPLAEQLPLLPVVEGLRQLHRVEGGGLLEDCLQDCPGYVRDDLA
ncbi:MAG TPA: AAA family ATPase, partial [Mycobacterium sp.]